MDAHDFKAWRKRLGYTLDGAAEALGMSRSAIINYEAGVRRDSGEPVVIPKVVALACAAVEAGLGDDKFAWLNKSL